MTAAGDKNAKAGARKAGKKAAGKSNPVVAAQPPTSLSQAPAGAVVPVAAAVVADPRIRCFAGEANATEAAARVFEAAAANLGGTTTRLFAGRVDLVALEIFAPPMQEQRSAAAGVYCVVVKAE